MATKGPNASGCWYCHTDDHSDEKPLVFCNEFDTYVHIHCAIDAFNKSIETGRNAQEAEIIYDEVVPDAMRVGEPRGQTVSPGQPAGPMVHLEMDENHVEKPVRLAKAEKLTGQGPTDNKDASWQPKENP